MAVFAEFARCRHCGGKWNVTHDPNGLARHESHCALRLACPLCDQPAGKPCRYPSGRTTAPHARRDRLARGA